MLETCVRLIHATPRRRRYRIESASPIDWTRLEQELACLAGGDRLGVRLNRACRSVVFTLAPPAAPALLQDAWARLCVAVERAGATPPPPPVLQVRVHVVRPSPLRWIRALTAPLNLISLGLSLGLLMLALLLAVLGILGMMLPLAPGAPLLLLTFLLMEAALTLRRPFVRPQAAA